VEIDYIIDLHHNARSARIKWGLKRMDFTVRKLNWKKWLYVNFKINRLPERHMVDRSLDTIKAFISERDSQGLDYFIPKEEEIRPDSLPPEFRKGFIGIAIGAQHATKMLPAESLVELCGRLRHPVIILGGPGDQTTGEAILSAWPGKNILNGCGKYSIHQSASLVKQARVLITHDTGLMHIGAAFHKPIISVWGNTVPRFGMYPYRPDPGSVQFEVQGLTCRPCSKIGHGRCPKKHFRCMLDQDLEGMAETAHRLYEER
jgi:ADP-heptose:LPS heptosyltransferase